MALDQRLIFKARNQAMRRLARNHYVEFNAIYAEEREKLGLPPLRDPVLPPTTTEKRSA